MHRSTVLALSLAFGAATASADFKSDIGFTALQAELGAALPNGSNIRVAQIEWTDGGNNWAPQIAGDLSGKSITYYSTPTGYSGHAGEVGGYFYGATGSIVPGINQVYSFEAIEYLFYSLGIFSSTTPVVATWEVENHSYSGATSAFDLQGTRCLDFRIKRDNIVATFSLDNTTSALWPMYHQGYNGIVVGTETGNHSRGTTFFATAGRTKPDIVGTATWTSYCAPTVASCAALIRSKAKVDSTYGAADSALVVKALLLAGADKSPFGGWAHTETQPLDSVWGAGRVHIGNSYHTLLAGRSQASTGAWAGNSGWDAGTSSAGSKWYYFQVPSGETVPFSAVLTWYANADLNTWGVSVTNLDLKLWSATSSRTTTSLVARSVSTIDNVEHIYVPSLAAGYYALEVVSPTASEAYGLAWLGSLTGGSAPVATAPSISTQPSSQTVTAGANVTFSVVASGTATLSYQWKKDGSNVSGATSSSLSLNSVSSTDAGSYTVVVTNSAGSATSNAATLTVNAAVVAPSITTQPSSQTVTAGANVTFSVVASGTATLSYQWKKDGSNVSGATSSSLSLNSVSSTDAGSYTVVVTNSAGSATSNAATLTVNAAVVAPSITTQPSSQSVTTGGNVTFSVVASGTATLSYQWKKDGSNVSGATSSSLSLTGVTSANAGTYTVVVTNSAGSATSTGATLTVTASATPPLITTDPASQTVTEGTNITLWVTLGGTQPITLQWYKDGVALSNTNDATLGLGAVTLASAGTYKVVATNSAGTVTSANAVLTVNAAAVAPSISTQPSSQTVTAGANVTFSVVASGTATLSYQWKKDGTNVSGATSSSLSLTNVTSANAGTYTVVVTNSAGSATSTGATLTVNAAVVAPSISTQPVSQTVTAGANVTFSAGANGTAPLTFQWKKDGSNIVGATSNSLSLTAVTSANAGSYTVVVTNSAGSATSNAATLTVNAAVVAPSITTQPASQSVVTGGNVTFSVVASGTATLSYQWKKDGSNVSGATSSSLSLTNVSSANAGTYTVVVTNSAGSATSTGATLTVTASATPPLITTEPATQTVTVGTNVNLWVTLGGTQPITLQWYKDGVALSNTNDATLGLGAVTLASAGTYRVVATNSAGTVTSANAVLTVNAAAVAPSITTQPSSQSVTAGANVTFSVVASGTATLSYQWKKDGSNVSGATSSSLSLTNVTSANAGTYTVVVTNSAGSATSNGATLTVSASAVAPSITTQPSSQSVTAGANVTFSVVASGTATLSYQWKKDGSNVSGATSSSLSLTNVTSANAGTYTVVVTNSAGNATSNGATLSVNAAVVAPSITLQPASQSVTTGTSVTFSVSATGTATLNYQWKKNGVAISGATSATCPLGAVTTANAGDYTVVVSNSAGSATSAVATLTVNAAAVAPTISSQPASQSAGFGGSATFTVTASGTGTLTYQWRKNGVNVSGGTNSTLVLAGLKGSDAGTYDVVVSNSVGSVTSNGATLTLTANRQLLKALATRAVVGSGDDILVTGIVIDGTQTKRLLVRAVGPTLGGMGVDGTITQPVLTVYSGQTAIARNQGWSNNSNAAEVRAVAATVGAFALSDGSQDSALLYDFAPGLYTIHVSGAGGVGGVALVEMYDADANGGTANFRALSARAMVGTGANILIPSLVVTGGSTKTVLVRAIGPQLAKFGVSGVLESPRLEVHKIGTDAPIASNQGWSNNADPAAIAAVSVTVGAFPLEAGSGDCAMLLTLGDGAYTFNVSGVGNTTGIALVEVYEL